MNEVLTFFAGLIALVVPGFGIQPEPALSGYVEADYVYVGAPTGGVVRDVAVSEGQRVKMGDVLFTLKDEQQVAALRGAEARVAAAKATAENLATGSRVEEVNVVRATLRKAETDLTLAEATSARTEKLVAQGLAPRANGDQAKASLESAKAEVAQLQAQLAVAELPARGAQQVAAEASVAAAEADAEQARVALADRTLAAPVDALVERLFFSAGEVAGAGVPVVSLLPDGALKAKFYVGEVERAGFVLGEVVAIACDGCGDGLTGTITYFASEPQNTPPIIYSRDERNRLVFLVEAKIEGGAVHPGQPISVSAIK